MGSLYRRADLVSAPGGQDGFGRFAGCMASFLGSRWGFACAGTAIVLWAASGPFLHFSVLWQLVVNTGTDIVTFLMVFLIQNTQNRDARAINLKLDELIRAMDSARNHMINIERLSDTELDVLEDQFVRLRQKHQHDHEGRGFEDPEDAHPDHERSGIAAD
jgi:low affinity Fe/Cu permease